MKTFFLILVACLLSSCGTNNRGIDKRVQSDENFDAFFKTFCGNSKFQKTRIVFPLKITSLDDENESTKLTDVKDWEYTNLIQKTKDEKKNILTFEVKNPNSMGVIFSVEDTGIIVNHIFEKINGKWFLTGILDESD